MSGKKLGEKLLVLGKKYAVNLSCHVAGFNNKHCVTELLFENGVKPKQGFKPIKNSLSKNVTRTLLVYNMYVTKLSPRRPCVL